MISFFKRLRIKLITANKLRRYFFYAIGEIILVVIGILIALQINNLNEQRIENNREQEILKQLRDEYLANLEQLDSKISLRNGMMRDMEDVLNQFEQQTVPNDSLFNSKLNSILLPITYDPIQNDLVSSGNINIIKNVELKKLLTNWTTDVHQLREVEQLFVELFLTTIIPYCNKMGIGRDMIKSFWDDSDRTNYLLEGENRRPIDIHKSTIALQPSSLITNAELESIVAFSYALNITNENESKALRNRILDILELLDSEIK